MVLVGWSSASYSTVYLFRMFVIFYLGLNIIGSIKCDCYDCLCYIIIQLNIILYLFKMMFDLIIPFQKQPQAYLYRAIFSRLEVFVLDCLYDSIFIYIINKVEATKT